MSDGVTGLNFQRKQRRSQAATCAGRRFRLSATLDGEGRDENAAARQPSKGREWRSPARGHRRVLIQCKRSSRSRTEQPKLRALVAAPGSASSLHSYSSASRRVEIRIRDNRAASHQRCLARSHPRAPGRETKHEMQRPRARGGAAAAATTAALARRIFQQKFSLQLAPGVIDWLETFVKHFEMEGDEEQITTTFEHLVRGCIGSGSGLGAFPGSLATLPRS